MRALSIQVETAERKRSELVMRAPISAADAVQLNESPSARRVLVIDDDRDVADSLAMLLDVLGCDVRTAYSGAVGVSLVSDFQPRIVFLDIGMPEMNGYETARRIRNKPAGRQAQLIAVTGWGQDLDKKRTREAGFDRHLVKPADIDILEEILAACGEESQQV
ncbi:MAG: response regulator [Methylocystis silviterrae]